MRWKVLSGIVLAWLLIAILPSARSENTHTLAERVNLSKNTITDWDTSINLLARGIVLGAVDVKEFDEIMLDYKSSHDWVCVFITKRFAELLDYSSDTIDNTVKWALEYAPMFESYALPKTEAEGYFNLWKGYALHGYRYSRELKHLTDKWNATSGLEALKACRISYGRAFYFCNPDTLDCRSLFGTRWMSTANLANAFMTFYREANSSEALDFALQEWKDLNNYYWTSGTHYKYSRTWDTWEWSGIEVFFNFDKLKSLNGTLGNWTRAYTDLQNRYLVSLWDSPQWINKAVAHANPGNPQRRLHGTEDAWLMLQAYFGYFDWANRYNMQNLLEGGTTTQAWQALLASPAGLYNPTTYRFKTDSTTRSYTDFATAEGCITLFLMGISPQNGLGLMIPKRCHAYSGEPFPIDAFGFNYDDKQIVIPVYGGTTLKFMFGTSHPMYTFSKDGVYRITFGLDWNSINSAEQVLHGSFLTPLETLEELLEAIETWNLPKGTEKSVTAKLDAIIHLLGSGNENGAIHKLMSLTNHVEALRDRKLTTQEAEDLISEAQRIINFLESTWS